MEVKLELKRGDRGRVRRPEIVKKVVALPFPFLSPSTQNLTISSRSCVGTAEKCTKKRDARAAGAVVLLTEANCVLGVLVAVAVVVS